MGQVLIEETLQRMKRLMYGHNYEVSFGADVLEQAHTLEQVKQVIQTRYPETAPEEAPLTLIGQGDFWEVLREYLDYRGDAGAGLTLTPVKEADLVSEQGQYCAFIKTYLSEKTHIYIYPHEQGLPCYYAFWFYGFILLNEDRPSLFLFGAASD